MDVPGPEKIPANANNIPHHNIGEGEDVEPELDFPRKNRPDELQPPSICKVLANPSLNRRFQILQERGELTGKQTMGT